VSGNNDVGPSRAGSHTQGDAVLRQISTLWRAA
jgi:hypothetical protein